MRDSFRAACRAGILLLCVGCIVLSAGIARPTEFEWTLVRRTPSLGVGITLLDEDTIFVTTYDRAGLFDIESWQIEWIDMPSGFRWPNLVHGPRSLWVSVNADKGQAPIWRLSDEGWSSYTPIDTLGNDEPWVHLLWVDQMGQAWASVDLSIQRFDGETWQSLNGDPGDTFMVVCGEINLGPDGNVWIGSQYGVFAYSHDGCFADFYAPGNMGGLPFNCMNALFHDSRDIHWFCGHKALIAFWGGQSFSLYDHISNMTQSLTCIDEDEFGNLWMGTRGQGVIFLSAEDGSFSHLLAPRDDATGWVHSVICARDGLTYVSTSYFIYAIARR